MAYAAYRDHEVLEPTSPALARTACFEVLPVTVNCADAWRVRRALAGCPGAGVLRCQILLRERSSTTETMKPRARLLVRLAPSDFSRVLQAVLRAVPTGELGSVISWREHLRRCSLEKRP